MAEDFAIGRALVIPKDVLSNLDKVDEKINKIATDSENMATKFTSAMSKMSVSTGDLIKKLQTIQGLVGGISGSNISGFNNVANGIKKTSTEAEKAANSITKVATAINKMGSGKNGSSPNNSVLAWQGIQKNIEQIEKKQDKLNALVKEYENTMSRINSGKGGSVSKQDQSAYNAAKLEIEANKQLIASYREKQNEIIKYQQLQRQQIQNQEKLASLARGEKSLSEIRSSEELKKLNQYYKELEQTSKKAAKEQETAARKAEAELKRQEAQAKKTAQTQARLDSQLRKSNYQSYITSFEGSLRTAYRADTYAKRAQAIKNLEEAIKKLRTTDANYQKDLQRLSDAHKRLSNEQKKVEANFKSIQNSQRKLMDTSGQLARQLALIFSVSQIEGYIMKLVKVRGEFELQNTALASILQNKDQADKLFGQITELAVKSPFTLMQLNTYTKQLAAYSVEYEKLYDTTKMLADVSAGLGVDMQRLILAFGQVKAANFLRGTETRQFTEAGINMLGELAKYYTELEGRIVSVAEVQERQFKRMISFADVEEVFKRLTSAGGMFYNMQERQAETLAGMMSNLQDSIDIMLNSIGESNEGVLKGVISTLRTIVDNWEILANIIKSSAVGFTVYVASVTKAAIANKAFAASNIEATISAGGLNKATAKIITSMKSLAVWAKSNPFVLIASAVSLAALSIVDHYKKVQKAKEEYDILTRSLDSSKKEIDGIKNKIEENNRAIEENSRKVSSLSNGTEEYQKAQNELNNAQKKQSSILEELKTKYPEIYDSIVKQKDGTVDMTEAQKAYNDELERTRTLNFIMQDQESFFGDGIFEDFRDLEEAQNDYTKATNNAQDVYNATILRLEKMSATSESFAKKYKSSIEQIQKSNDSYENKLKRLRDLAPSTIFNEGYFAFSDITTALYGFSDAFTVYSDKANDANKQIDKLIENALATIGVYSEDAFKGLEDSSKQSAKRIIENFVNTIPNIKNEFIQQFVNERLNLKLGFTLDFNKETPKELSDWQKRINKYIEDNNLEIKPILATDTVDSYFGNLRNELKESQKEAEKLRNATEQRGESGASNKEQLAIEEERINNITKLLNAYDELDDKKNKSKGDNKELQRLKDQIALIKKAGEEYKKLCQYYSEEEATQIVRKSFGDAFDNLGLSVDMTFDTSGIIEGIKNLQYEAIKGGKEAVNKTLAEFESEKNIKVKVDGIKEIQKQIDSIFTNYEFSLELKTAGIDSDAFKNMLKSVGATDEEISLAGLDVTTFEQAQKKIRDIINDLQKQGGKEQLELAKKYQEQLTQLEVKEARKRFDELLALREKYQSNEEKIAKIESDISSWQKELDNIKQLGESANKEQEELLEMRIQNGNDAILKLKSEALQLTEFWRTLFGDLEDLSVNSLRRLSDTVDEVIGSSKEIKGNKGQIVGYSAEYTDKDGLKKQVTLTVEQYQRLLKQNNQVADEIQKKNPFIALFDAIIDGKKEGETKLDYIVRLEGILGDVSDAAFQVASDLAEIFSADDEAKELISNIKGIADGAISLGTGIARIASGDPAAIFSGSISAISGIANVVSSINKIHDNKREKEIERQTYLVEDLERAYDKLYDTIENGLSIDSYSQNAALIKNLTQQVESYERMIAAEMDKKDSDEDRIREWENQIDDIYSQIDELYQNLKTNLVGDFKSVSQQLGDAIAEAFANGTDAAEAWGDSVKEIVADMVKNLLVQKLIEPGVQQILDQLFENMKPKEAAAQGIKEQIDALYQQLDSLRPESASPASVIDYKKRKEELENQIRQLEEQYQQAVAASEGEVPNLTQDIINNTIGQLEQLGDDVLNNPAWDMLKELLGQEGDTMSSLQRGIEGLSETTGQALEALLNSMRFFVSDSNTVLHNIYNAIAMPTVENPFLAEMKVQSNYLNNLNALVGSVIKNSNGKGKVLRVEIA